MLRSGFHIELNWKWCKIKNNAKSFALLRFNWPQSGLKAEVTEERKMHYIKVPERVNP